MKWNVAVKWGPAWTDAPPEDADNYDHSFYEGLTLEEAVARIRKFEGRVFEVTLTPADPE